MADIPDTYDVQAELEAARRAGQIERERALLAEGLAELERGEFYDWSVVKAWMQALETDPDAKLPPLVPRPWSGRSVCRLHRRQPAI